MTLKDDLLSFGKTPVVVDLADYPDFNGKVFVRSLTTGERLILDELRSDGHPLGDHEFVLLGACDAEGKRLFDPNEVKDLDGRLAAKIGVAVVRVSGLADTSKADAEKKSEAGPS